MVVLRGRLQPSVAMSMMSMSMCATVAGVVASVNRRVVPPTRETHSTPVAHGYLRR